MDVSNDVIHVSQSSNLDGVSPCSVTLNNYSNNLQGRYNSIVKIGDRLHLDLYDGGVQFPRFTGYAFSAPQYAYNANSFEIGCHDLIGAMQWKLWNPYAEASYKRYVAPFAQIASAWEVILICITSVVGIFGVSAALEGYLLKDMSWYQRVMSAVGGLMLIIPGLVTDSVGLCLVAAVVVMQLIQRRKEQL